jgi:hypothetical protein
MMLFVEKQKLIDTLRDLKENRRLSSESEAILKPFVGVVSEFTFAFSEANSTFSCRLEDRYSRGKTVVSQFAGFELECVILFPLSENEWVESLSKEDQFNLKVVVLDFDNLYQRVVLGKFFDADEKDDFQVDQPSEVKAEEISQSIVEQGGNFAIENAHGAVSNSESSSDNVEEEVSVSSFSNEETENTVIIKEKTQDEKGLGVEGTNDLGLEDENEVEDIENSKPLKVDDTNLNKEDEKVEPKEKPPRIPSLNVQKKAKEIDYLELERIRDKRYEEGAVSLTEEEQEILSLASKRGKKSFAIPTSTKNKKSSQKHKADEDNIVGMGCRGLGGVLVGFFGLQALSNGWGLASLVIFGIAWYLLKPIIKKLRED